MNARTQAALTERAAKLGRGLKYRYDGMARDKAFKGNDNQWALIHNWSVKSFKTLQQVADELERIERSAQSSD